MRDHNELRKQILSIHATPNISEREKSLKVQELMTSSLLGSLRISNKENSCYNSQSSCCTTASAASKCHETEKIHRHHISCDSTCMATKTYHDKEQKVLGCSHYKRSVRIQAPCCQKWYGCRLCHDANESHKIDRYAVNTIQCLHCGCVQGANKICENKNCGISLGKYHCKICKLWDDDETKNIYHCDKCGMCRVGQGDDYYHCDTCNVCMSLELKGKHKCIERNLESNCPICHDYMFTSTKTIIFMKCGHCIHHACYKDYIKTSYKCPVCVKSLGDMTEYFKRIDQVVQSHCMPPEYKNSTADILCNDCSMKSYNVPFHFQYHKCSQSKCGSYNTSLIRAHHRHQDIEQDSQSTSMIVADT